MNNQYFQDILELEFCGLPQYLAEHYCPEVVLPEIGRDAEGDMDTAAFSAAIPLLAARLAEVVAADPKAYLEIYETLEGNRVMDAQTWHDFVSMHGGAFDKRKVVAETGDFGVTHHFDKKVAQFSGWWCYVSTESDHWGNPCQFLLGDVVEGRWQRDGD